jgi:hypothetical protein
MMARVQNAPAVVQWETAEGIITQEYDHGWQAKEAISACVDNLMPGEKLTVMVTTSRS